MDGAEAGPPPRPPRARTAGGAGTEGTSGRHGALTLPRRRTPGGQAPRVSGQRLVPYLMVRAHWSPTVGSRVGGSLAPNAHLLSSTPGKCTAPSPGPGSVFTLGSRRGRRNDGLSRGGSPAEEGVAGSEGQTAAGIGPGLWQQQPPRSQSGTWSQGPRFLESLQGAPPQLSAAALGVSPALPELGNDARGED